MALERNMAQLEAYKQQAAQEQQKLKDAMGKIKHKIAIISGKGGVGKSTVTVNLATAFAMQGQTRRSFRRGHSWTKCAKASGFRRKTG